MKMLKLVAAGHQPAADHILERFEIFGIFGSMVRWFNQSVTVVRFICFILGFKVSYSEY